MNNRFFDAQMLDLLLSPGRWRIVTSATPSDGLPSARQRHPAWRKIHRHGHQHVELLFGLRGESNYGFLDKVYLCRPGTLIFFDAFEEHDQGYPADVRNALHLWVSFVQDRIIFRIVSVNRGRTDTVPGSNCMIAMEDAGIQVGQVLAECRSAAGHRPVAAIRLRLAGVFATVLGRIVEEGYREPSSDTRDTLQSQTIDAIRRHILATGGSDASLDNLARISGYSKFHFVRMFKRYTGQPVGRYVNWCRTQRMEELRKNGLSLKEVGAALGFSCQSAFSRWRRNQAVLR